MSTERARCIVLRPSPDGEALTRALADAGLDALHLPTMRIEPRPHAPLPTVAPTLLLFVSPNAVRHGRTALDAAPDVPVAAIGATTARLLAGSGRPADVVPPDGGYTSEALLAAPALADMADARVWIVRGEGGRELIADTLRERGAEVHYVEVYERQNATHDALTLARAREWLAARPPAIVIATSVETLQGLYGLLPDTRDYRLVSASDRVIQLAASRGVSHAPARAAGPDAASLVACARRMADATPATPPHRS